ncbi:hypothetical protein DB30_00696 [Enhygromyxa salina]|uniref:Uncharacterized protein n=1 Tax=Enhygromyxa salina TaxID=215803 RepID=A0A0C2D5G5_9BACT|nr:TIGR02996 domain-containing protein [Enhygromyxa salina]KIG18411.1 hypothetical protein DB30_00696 [Enhygromyxa salina]
MALASNQQRLLESIYDDPRANDARRVYADWLVGRGDPRGEFIHLQVDRFRGQATVEQFARERALLDQHCARGSHRVRARICNTRRSQLPECGARVPGPADGLVDGRGVVHA